MAKRGTRGWSVALVTLSLTLASSGCSVPAAADRAGSVPSQAVELVMAAPNGPSELMSFADAVAQRSDGSIRVEILDRKATAEVAGSTGGDILDAVRTGDVSLAAIPVRDFAGLGIASLDPLIAPFVIDSLALQGEVLKDAALVASMTNGLASEEASALGILPGPLQYAYGITRDLTRPADFEGATIAFSPSEVADEALTALGAEPRVSEFYGAPIDGFDGIVSQLSAVTGNSYHEIPGSVATDSPLWTRPYVVIANAAALASLSPTQRKAVQDAVLAAIDGGLARQRGDDKQSMSILCTSGNVRFIQGASDDLAALRRAVQPVLDRIRSNPDGAADLDRIEAIRSRTEPEPAPTCPAVSADWPTAVSTLLDGTYVSDTTADDLRAQGVPEMDVVPGNWGHWVFVVEDGRFALTQENESACTWGYGQWRMDDRIARMTMEAGGSEQSDDPVWKRGEDFAWWWTEFDGMLQLSSAMDAGPPGLTFTRLSNSPDPSAFPARCAPPAGAFSTE